MAIKKKIIHINDSQIPFEEFIDTAMYKVGNWYRIVIYSIAGKTED